jgi:hypothetical protein
LVVRKTTSATTGPRATARFCAFPRERCSLPDYAP